MNGTLIIVLFLIDWSGNALLCERFQVFENMLLDCHLGKIRQDEARYYYL